MSFLAGAAGLIAAAIAVPALLALYFLKLRRKPMVVSSTLLWKKAIQDLQVNAPFQKLRKSLLLLLQMLALAALLFAFARPILQGAKLERGSKLVIVIDTSASMRATDEKPSRLERAKDEALKVIDSLDGSENSDSNTGAMVVTFSQQARVVQPFTTDRTLLRRAVQNIQATDQPGHLQPALKLIEPFVTAQATDDTPQVSVLVFSDGRTQDGGDLVLRGAELKFVRFGQPAGNARNVAITALSARRDLRQPDTVEVFTSIANFSNQRITGNVTLSIDDQVLRVLPVALDPAGVADDGTVTPGSDRLKFEFDLIGDAVVTVSHDVNDDLGADNAARLVITPPQQLEVLLVTAGNVFLEKVIESVNVRRLVVLPPDRFEQMDASQLAAGGFDLIVFDRYAPNALPVMPSLFFGVTPAVQGLSLEAWSEPAAKSQAILDWKRSSAMMRYVALDDVILIEPGRLVLPDDAEVLASGLSGPVIARFNMEGVPAVATSFELFKSNWPMQVSFAVFMNNVIYSLGMGAGTTEGGAGLSFTPGEVASVPAAPTATNVRYTGPQTLAADVSLGRAVLPMFDEVGLYKASGDAVRKPWDRLAVNLTNDIESNLYPIERLAVMTGGTRGAQDPATLRHEIWWWFALAALVVLMIEWMVYARKMYL